MLLQLTYARRISKILAPGDLKAILEASQRNNARVGVTGALCLTNGIFLQQLESDRSDVNALYHRVLQDLRHRDRRFLTLLKSLRATSPSGPWVRWRRSNPTERFTGSIFAPPALTSTP